MISNKVDESALTISVIGCGYLGAVHAVCLANLGHRVIGIDIDDEKIERGQLGPILRATIG
jgi:UDPglucose 6-dehydrogenase